MYKNHLRLAGFCMASLLFFSCGNPKKEASVTNQDTVKQEFNFIADRFADVQVLRYKINGFDELSLQQKQLAYYLWNAGLSGRDIYYDQKNHNNLRIRKTIECILETYKGDKAADNYKKFETYCKRFFFANGVHHHYAAVKMVPECSFDFFKELVEHSDQSRIPLDGLKMEEYLALMQKAVFDPNADHKVTDLSAGIDNVKASANNFYEGVTQKEVEAFYDKMAKEHPGDKSPFGLNSKLVKENGKIVEKIWKSGGMYGAAIDKIVYWLQKATTVTENEQQKQTLEKLIQFYKTGEAKTFDDYSISWVGDTASRFDAVIGFIEVYMDAMNKRGSYESVVSMKDMEATKVIAAISKEAQWFEDHSPIMDNHKKKNVKGISAKVITVIGESGEAAPSTPIGINLPNNEWIRESHGSKSVSLGNIVQAYNYARAKSPMIDEFGHSEEMKKRYRQYAALSGELHTDMHEVIGHASGQLNPGVGTTDKTLKNYASALEEARADLVGLYYIMDQKLVDIGVMSTLEVGKAQYDYYIMNGMMTQLYRIEPGSNIEEAHMRNRQLIAAWAFEKGAKDKVIEKVVRDGKTYFVINDYTKLRDLFGQLLREIQRLKSEGDFNAGKNLIENYGVKADQALLTEVHKRYEKLNIAPYMGFIQPILVPVMDGDNIKDVKVEYPESFLEEMLNFGKNYSFLPIVN